MPASSSQIQYRTPGLNFSTDWFEANAQHWPRMFQWLGWDSSAPHYVLEIGCFEGAATCWMLENLLLHPESLVWVIDTFEGSPDHTEDQRADLENKFKANIARTRYAHQVIEYVGRSREILAKIQPPPTRKPLDFIYIDGSHEAQDVLSDLVLGWDLLAAGGLLVCDDFEWSGGDGPRLAVHAFMSCYDAQIDLGRSPLQQGAQFAFVKRG